MKARLLFLFQALVVAALVAGCGSGGSAALQPGDVAVVGSAHITSSQFKTLMNEAKINTKGAGQTFPKAGTTAYSQVKSEAMTLLVQEAERQAAATKLGLVVTPKDIETQLKKVVKQYFGGSDAKYKAELKTEGLKDSEVRANIKSQLIASKLTTALTKTVSVTPAAVSLYYDKHLTTYQTPASREVRYILVGKNKSSLAQTLFQQLKGAPNSTWCTLAKKYSLDTSTKKTCGKPSTPFTKGGTVAEFDKALFSLATNTVAKVNTTQDGWFVMQPIAKITPATKEPFSKEAKSIAKTLLKTKKDTFMTNWAAKLQKSYCKGGQIKYQVGYEPSPDPCAATNTTTT